MGNFYVNHSVKDASQQQVVDVLQRSGRLAFVTPAERGYIVVYDKEADRQELAAVLHVGTLLARELHVPVFAVLNHDDDVLCYWLFERGDLIDSYTSCPDCFEDVKEAAVEQGGDARRLCDVLAKHIEPSRVEAILRSDHLFALDQHQQLVEVLGLPTWSVGLGYDYVVAGDAAEVMDATKLIRTGP